MKKSGLYGYRFTNDCHICGKYFSDRPFENMDGSGESTISRIELFGEEYTLCPKCTAKLSKWITEQQRENS